MFVVSSARSSKTRIIDMSVSALTGHTSVMEAKISDFRIFGFSENVDLGNFPLGFGVWEGLQSIGNGCGLQMDGFSAHFEPSEFILDHFHDFDNFESFSVV